MNYVLSDQNNNIWFVGPAQACQNLLRIEPGVGNKVDQPEFLSALQDLRPGQGTITIEGGLDRYHVTAEQLRVEWAWLENPRAEPVLDWWLLGAGQRWLDVIRGDGHCYGGYHEPLPNRLLQRPNETREGLIERAKDVARSHDTST